MILAIVFVEEEVVLGVLTDEAAAVSSLGFSVGAERATAFPLALVVPASRPSTWRVTRGRPRRSGRAASA